jgi:hypothetical protein
MSNLPRLIHDGALVTGVAGILYSATVTTAAMTALLARDATRRRDAREVLKILLRRNDRQG